VNPILDMYYRGYTSHLYTLPEVLEVFSRAGVYAEDLVDSNYDPEFLTALPKKEKKEIIRKRRESPIRPSTYLRPSTIADEPILEELSIAFQQELYGNPDKEHFLSLDALVLLSPLSEGKIQGALWYQTFDEGMKGAELYIRSLFVRPEFRSFGAGKSLVEFACEKAEELAFPKVSVNSPDNRTSFYRSLDFRRKRSERETEGCVYLVKNIDL